MKGFSKHMKKKDLAVFPITERGYALARRAAGLYRDAVIYRPVELKRAGLKKLVGRAFTECSGLLFISAVGIAVRVCAPFLKGKDIDPAVVVMDEGGRFAISLISGHLGGANKLAQAVANLYGAAPVITTATDVAGLPCVEDAAGLLGLIVDVDDVKKIKLINSAILKGLKVYLIDDGATRRNAAKQAFANTGVFTFRKSFPACAAPGTVFVCVTPFIGSIPIEVRRKTLVLRPREFVMGVGCGKGVDTEDIDAAFKRILKEARISRLSVRNLATIDVKSNEAGLLEFAEREGLGLHFFTAAKLNRIRPPSGRSTAAIKATGAQGVAEAAAILSAGGKKIWTKKTITGRVTTALARVESPSSALGRAR